MKKITITITVLVYAIMLSFAGCSNETQGKGYGESIDSLLKTYYCNNEPGISVIAVKDDSIIYKNAIGLANMELNVELNPEMVFKIGSVTKQFTAAGILLLKEKGLLDLDNDVRKYIPEFPKTENQITIKHLLNHTSGIDDHIEWGKIKNEFSVNDNLNSFKNRPLKFNAGEGFCYSNPGYGLLGMIIEKVSGQSYHEYIDDNIIKPLKLNNTCVLKDRILTQGLVNGYEKIDSIYYNAPYFSNTHSYSAGAMASNTEDLYTWVKALLSEKVISKKSLIETFTPATLYNGEKTNYGYGWFIKEFKGRKLLTHGGGVPGFISNILILPEEKIFVIAMTNRRMRDNSLNFITLNEMIASILIDEPIVIKDKSVVELTEEQYLRFEGKYIITDESGRESTRKIMYIDNKLYFGLNKMMKVEIKPESELSFFVEGAPGGIKFIVDEEYNVIGFEKDNGSKVEIGRKKSS